MRAARAAVFYSCRSPLSRDRRVSNPSVLKTRRAVFHHDHTIAAAPLHPGKRAGVEKHHTAPLLAASTVGMSIKRCVRTACMRRIGKRIQFVFYII